MQAMGVVIGAAGGYSFESFRLAWTVQYAIWAWRPVGILITRKKARERAAGGAKPVGGLRNPRVRPASAR